MLRNRVFINFGALVMKSNLFRSDVRSITPSNYVLDRFTHSLRLVIYYINGLHTSVNNLLYHREIYKTYTSFTTTIKQS